MNKTEMKKSISIRNRIIIMITLFIMLFAFVIGLTVFNGWISTAEETTQLLSEDMNQAIIRQVDSMLRVPYHINEVNQKLIAQDIVNITDEKERDKFFVTVLQSHSNEIYSFTYGTETGEYYGACRNKDGEFELFKNNSETKGQSWYYTVTEDLSAGELVEQTEIIDSRTREWYSKAKESGSPTYSSVHKHFALDDLTISAAWPIYKEDVLQGVLGSHMLLSSINQYLDAVVNSKKGFAYIIEKKSGELVANSFEANNAELNEDGTFKRNRITEIANTEIVHSYQQYTSSKEKHYLYKGKENNYYINISEYQRAGVDWLIVSAVPSELFMNRIFSNILITGFVIIMFLLLTIMFSYFTTKRIINPINNLITAMEQVSQGDLLKRATIFRNDEIGRISMMFNQTADKMNQLVNHLEDKVKERTSELVSSNEQIQYLSLHDTLTGLKNRHYFEKAIKQYDTEANLPISIIFADLNGLKMVNDIFGHYSGDILVEKAANVLKKYCRSNDTIARVGGDEFIILMPNTEQSVAGEVVDRIRSELSKEHVHDINCSLALGYDTKTSKYQDIEKVIGSAESEMYKDKTLSRKSFAKETIKIIINSFHKKYPLEKIHSEHVAKLCERMGKALNLPIPEIKRLQDAGYLHDIGKLVFDENLLNSSETSYEMEKQLMIQHSVVSYRILKLFDDTVNLADDVYAHHEKWDGTGYPKGLKGLEIPLRARIIAITESYDRMLTMMDREHGESIEQVLEKIQAKVGTNFDPELTEIFIKMIRNNEDAISE